MLEAIKELRARTHLGMTACKQALEACAGDIEKAIEQLQKQGTIKRAEELVEAKEGLVQSVSFGEYGLIVEATCQTDFAARSDIFKKFVTDILSKEHVAATTGDQRVFDIPEAKAAWCTKQLGETVAIRRRAIGFVDSKLRDASIYIARAYNHHSGKIAVLLVANCQKEDPEVLEFLDECAMQIAANNPLGLNREGIAGEETKQRAIFAEQVPPKAEKMKDKIIQGKIDKWYAEVVLSDQESIVHPKKTISQLQSELSARHGAISLMSFIRYELGQ